MGNMRFKVGDRVRIKSLDWYNENKDKDGEIVCGEFVFLEGMKKFCSETLTILEDVDDGYLMLEDDHGYVWTDEMIEGLVEEEISQNAKLVSERFSEYVNPSEVKYAQDTITKMLLQGANIPNEYILKDENGNVINAQKIVLEKKKKEYPKTYEECCKVLGVNPDNFLSIRNLYRDDGDEELTDYERDLLGKFDSLWELRICRDAYWKIAGEEMKLGKPWEPDWSTENEIKYVIEIYRNNVRKNSQGYSNTTLAFPTAEMRDVFYENFKELIEFCKEFL